MAYAPLPTIAETPDDLRARLRARLRAERDPERKRRLHALALLASGQATTRRQVAGHLAVHRNTVASWLDRYRDGGLAALLTPSKRGPGQRTVPAPVLDAVQARLVDGVGFKGYDEVRDWLSEEHGLDVPYKSVYTPVRYRLGAKLKVPRPEHPKKA